jgi:hypothetical protein
MRGNQTLRGGSLGPRFLSISPAKCSASKRAIQALTVGRDTCRKRLMLRFRTSTGDVIPHLFVALPCRTLDEGFFLCLAVDISVEIDKLKELELKELQLPRRDAGGRGHADGLT